MIIKLKTIRLNNDIDEQLSYFNITKNYGALSERCWIKIGENVTPYEIIQKNRGGDEIEGWIEFIGLSRIDGYPMFNFNNDCIDYKNGFLNFFRKNKINTISENGENVNWKIIDNLMIDLMSYYKDDESSFKQKVGMQIFSKEDPYGEENWDE